MNDKIYVIASTLVRALRDPTNTTELIEKQTQSPTNLAEGPKKRKLTIQPPIQVLESSPVNKNLFYFSDKMPL